MKTTEHRLVWFCCIPKIPNNKMAHGKKRARTQKEKITVTEIGT